MADGLENLPRRLEEVGQRIDARFEQVLDALVEQRRYTEFAYQRLDSKIDALSARMDQRFDRMEQRLDGIDGRFNRLERKLDQFIDRHT